MKMQSNTQFNKSTFDTLFKDWYQDLCRFAYTYLRDEDLCEDIVQEVFISLWEKRKSLAEIQSFKSYLFRAVRNKCIDNLRKEMRFSIFSLENEGVQELSYYDYSLEAMESDELKNHIEESIKNLPKSCRNIFVLSREAKLTYAEIADEIGVSRKTVENQIGIALKKIRKHLIDNKFITLAFILFFA